jgi:hypothetical protein
MRYPHGHVHPLPKFMRVVCLFIQWRCTGSWTCSGRVFGMRGGGHGGVWRVLRVAVTWQLPDFVARTALFSQLACAGVCRVRSKCSRAVVRLCSLALLQ